MQGGHRLDDEDDDGLAAIKVSAWPVFRTEVEPKKSTWDYLSTTARAIAAGKMRACGSGAEMESFPLELPGPFGGIADGPFGLSGAEDLSAQGPSGLRI